MTKKTSSPELLCNRCGETRPAAVSPARWKKIAEGKDTFLCKECVDEAVETGVYDVDFIKERRVLQAKNAPLKWEYLLKWKGFDEAQSSWEPEDSLTFCEEAKREFDKKDLEQLRDGSPTERKRKKSREVSDEDTVRAQLGVEDYDLMVSQLNGHMPPGMSKKQEVMWKQLFIKHFVKVWNMQKASKRKK